VQIRQIAAMIQRDLNGGDVGEFTKDLDTAITTFQRSVTRDTTRLYECMGDAYQCHLRVHLAVTKLFHLGLPLLMNEYLYDPLGVKLVNRFCDLQSLEADSIKFQELIRQVSANPKNRAVGNFIKVQSGASMNYRFFEHHRDEDIPASLSHLLFGLARLRLALLAKLGWRGLICFSQHWALWKDVFRGLLLVPFHRTKFRESWPVRWAFRSRGPAFARKNDAAGSPETINPVSS
jgi:hypothetical protein